MGMIYGLGPVVGLVDDIGADRRPDLDIARRIGADRLVAQRIGVMADTAPHTRVGEDAVDGGEHVVGRTERPGELEVGKARLRIADAARKQQPAFSEGIGGRALEGIDRLFLVADGKNGAMHGARALAREELVGQPLHDLPLVGAGVLRLVEQDVVDALVELVLHPGAGIGPCQEAGGFDDEVVEVEETTASLQRLVAGDQPFGDHEGGARALQHPETREPVRHVEDRLGCRVVAVQEIGQAIDEPLLEGAGTIGIAVGLEEGLAEQIEPPDRVLFGEGRHRVGQDVVQHGACFDILAGAGEGCEIGRWEARQRPCRRRDRIGALAGGKAELGEQRLEVGIIPANLDDEGAQVVALAHDLAQQGVEPGLAAAFEHHGERLGQPCIATAGARDHVAPGGGEERSLHLRIKQLEMGGNVGFQRKLMQHRFTEGMDGLDLQPARRLQGFGEQAPGAAHGAEVGTAAFQRLDPHRQFGIAQCRPFRQRGEDAVRHVGGGGPRIGQAQDLRRVGAAEQQPDDALGEHVRLAGAGIGGNPGGISRIGRARLAGDRIGRNRVGLLHGSPPSSPASPPADHSSTRARWS